METKKKIFEEFLRWWLLWLNNDTKPMSEPTMPSAKIFYFDLNENYGDKKENI